MNKVHSRPLMNSSHLLSIDRLNLMSKPRNSSTCVLSTDSVRDTLVSFVYITLTNPERQLTIPHVIDKDSWHSYPESAA